MIRILRFFQLQAVLDLREAISQGFLQIMLMLPTGAGKTVIASEIVLKAYEKGKSVLFVCDRIELINQTSQRFLADGIPHGVIQGDHDRTDRHQRIQVASIQTLARRRLPIVDLIIIDEAHTLHKAHINLIERNKGTPIIGLSATPFARGLGKYFKKLIVGATTSQLIKEGYLVQPRVYAPSEPDLDRIKLVAGDYDQHQLAQVTNQPKLVGNIVEHWRKLALGRPTICFAVNIAHSKAIVDAFKKEGISAMHLDAYSSPEDRADAVAAFKRGEYMVMSSVDLFSKGFDYPGASCAIMARPTKSLMLYIQQAGRVLRIAEGKDDCIILDHAGNTIRLGRVTDALPTELNNGTKKESIVKLKTEKLPKICTKCKFIKDTLECPSCGFKPEFKKDVATLDSELVALTAGKVSISKKNLYGELKHVAQLRGWSTGRLAHVYKGIAGSWPNDVRNSPLRQASPEVLAKVKSLDIRFSKSGKMPRADANKMFAEAMANYQETNVECNAGGHRALAIDSSVPGN